MTSHTKFRVKILGQLFSQFWQRFLASCLVTLFVVGFISSSPSSFGWQRSLLFFGPCLIHSLLHKLRLKQLSTSSMVSSFEFKFKIFFNCPDRAGGRTRDLLVFIYFLFLTEQLRPLGPPPLVSDSLIQLSIFSLSPGTKHSTLPFQSTLALTLSLSLSLSLSEPVKVLFF